MKRIAVFLVVIASCLCTVNAVGADWKYYGEGNQGTKDNYHSFYDADSFTANNNVIKIWVKYVIASEMNKYKSNGQLLRTITMNSYKKISDGYTAPIIFANNRHNDLLYNQDITELEEIANQPTVNAKWRLLVEIDCRESMSRIISTILFDKRGKIDFSESEPIDWQTISSDSNMEMLGKILCTYD